MKRIWKGVLRGAMVFVFVALGFEAAMPKYLFDTQSKEAFLQEATETVLRLHIVANSDKEEDQRVKLLVRDALLEEFSPANSLIEAERIVLGQGNGILETVQSVLEKEGCAYGAQLRFGQMEFPLREYGETTYPAGEYTALRVELGQAAGQNWWCVLFPPICLLDIGVTEIENSDEIVFESDLLDLLFR